MLRRKNLYLSNISTYREMFEKIKKALGKCGNVPRNIEKAGMLT